MYIALQMYIKGRAKISTNDLITKHMRCKINTPQQVQVPIS